MIRTATGADKKVFRRHLKENVSIENLGGRQGRDLRNTSPAHTRHITKCKDKKSDNCRMSRRGSQRTEEPHNGGTTLGWEFFRPVGTYQLTLILVPTANLVPTLTILLIRTLDMGDARSLKTTSDKSHWKLEKKKKKRDRYTPVS